MAYTIEVSYDVEQAPQWVWMAKTPGAARVGGAADLADALGQATEAVCAFACTYFNNEVATGTQPRKGLVDDMAYSIEVSYDVEREPRWMWTVKAPDVILVGGAEDLADALGQATEAVFNIEGGGA